MTYREATPWAPTGKVVHGSFPVRLGRLAIGLVGLLAAPAFCLMAFDDAHLECVRPTDRCRYEGSHFTRPETFRLSQLRDVRVAIESGSKNSKHGVPYLDLSGPELRLASTSVDEANRFAQAVRQALQDKRARFRLDLEAERGFAFPAAFFLVLAISALLGALRGIGRVVMVATSGTLRLTRRICGVPIWTGVVDLRGATDVEVEWVRRKTFWTAKYSPGDTYGRLVLVRGAEREPLTPISFPGYHLHRRGEHQLRELLALPPRPPEREQALASQAAAVVPPVVMGGVAGTFGLVWLGLCCGSLVALPLAWLVLMPFGLAGRQPSTAVFTVGVPLGAALGVVTALYLRRRAATR